MDAGEFATGDKGDTDLGGGDGSDVGLAFTAPVHLDMAGPGNNGEVLAETDTPDWREESACRAVKSGPGANARLMAVGAGNIARMEYAAVGPDGSSFDSLHYRLPMETDSQFSGPVE